MRPRLSTQPAGAAPGHAPAPRQVARLLLKGFRRRARDLPWRRTVDPYAIWVSEVMLQQTQVATVIPYYERWMQTFPSLSALARAPLHKVLALWSGLGYYSRPRRLRDAARQLIRGGGQWPTNVADWQHLPGVGRYTAGAICSIAFNQPAPVVDGNVERVVSRLWRLRTPGTLAGGRQKVWALAEAMVGEAARLPTVPGRHNCGDFNQALMELGATVCTPRRPRCQECVLAADCGARRRGDPESFPSRVHRPATVQRCVRVWVIRRRGRYWLGRPPKARWNRGLWEFRTEVLPRERPPRRGTQRPTPAAKSGPEPLFRLTHTITHHRFRVEVVVVVDSRAAPRPRHSGGWYTPQELAAMPLSGLCRKILKRLEAAPPNYSPSAKSPKADS